MTVKYGEHEFPREFGFHGSARHAKGGRHFIQKMHLKKGALHRQLGIPEGEKIPEARLEAASHSSNKLLAKRANTAKMLKGLRKG